MFRSILIATAVFGTATAFGDGPGCEFRDANPGNCIKVSDCSTNEWSFGTIVNPLCDKPGANYKSPDTKVCCFDSPVKPDTHKLKKEKKLRKPK
tara:strand:- start:1543 stop:1824 length:282 start_codon:yes stop_codon:yes gene_type:complete